uniref:43 kDa tail protein n=1 Tax=Siphoviridae sp. ctdd214 TaxID=2825581 RepID=A0A8S5V620_9CAUD|nr:MAG TPA: 43 kDa tail protein [Siphoviridae sp. ctdd214]
MAKTQVIISHNRKLYEISKQCTKISFDDKLNDGSSKLSLTVLGSINDFDNGDAIQFIYNDVKIFNGFIFEVEQNRKKEVTITAHDQLRYCKAKDLIAITNKDTATTLVNRMITYLQLKKGAVVDTKYKLSFDAKTGSTWLDVIYEKMSETLLNTGKKYVLRDEFGKICLRDITKCYMNFIIGDKSLLYDYTYKKSINDDFYNQVKLYGEIDSESKSTSKSKTKKTTKTKKLEIVMMRDNNSIKKYGTLQYFEDVSGKESQINKAKMKEKAKVLLADYNRTKNAFSVECIGVPEVRAGNIIKVVVNELGAKENHIVESVTHEFLPVHTMSIEFAEVFEKESGKSDIETITKTRTIKASEATSNTGTSIKNNQSSSQTSGEASSVISIARSFIGKVTYVFGASSPESGRSDCSGFTQYCYKKVGVSIGRTTNDQVRAGSKVEKSNLQPGDLIMFKNTYNSGYLYGVSHVGIYLGGGEFIHCSSSKGVTISSLNSSYYKEHYLMGRRVL